MEQVGFTFAPATTLLHCRKCNSDKPQEAFGRNATSKTGRQSQCRDCGNAWQRNYYQTNPERRASVLERARAASRDPEKNREHYERRRNDPERWAAILAKHREASKTPERREYRAAYNAAYMATPEGRAKKRESERKWKARPEVQDRLRRLERERKSADWLNVNTERREAYRASPEAQRRNKERRHNQHVEIMDGVFRVYFIESPSLNAIKIGRTRGKAAARLLALQTATPDALCLLGVIRNASHDDETALHRKFKHLRLRGEWFRVAPELTEYIDANAGRDE